MKSGLFFWAQFEVGMQGLPENSPKVAKMYISGEPQLKNQKVTKCGVLGVKMMGSE